MNAPHKRPALLMLSLVTAAAMGLPPPEAPFRVGVTSAKPHDPERIKAAQLKRERKAAKKTKGNP